MNNIPSPTRCASNLSRKFQTVCARNGQRIIRHIFCGFNGEDLWDLPAERFSLGGHFPPMKGSNDSESNYRTCSKWNLDSIRAFGANLRLFSFSFSRSAELYRSNCLPVLKNDIWWRYHGNIAYKTWEICDLTAVYSGKNVRRSIDIELTVNQNQRRPN